jgi:hypothetical protein
MTVDAGRLDAREAADALIRLFTFPSNMDSALLSNASKLTLGSTLAIPSRNPDFDIPTDIFTCD